MGNCTYVLVEERYTDLDFAVYVTTYDCGHEVSCPSSIIVVYNSEEVNVTVPDKKDLAIKLVSRHFCFCYFFVHSVKAHGVARTENGSGYNRRK